MVPRIITVTSALIFVVLLAMSEVAWAEIELVNPDSRETVNSTQIGLSMGTPAFVNAEFVKDTNSTTLAFSGMYWNGAGDEGARGFQVGSSLLRSARTNSFKSLSLIGGYSHMKSYRHWYGGMEGFVQSGGWFFALGGVWKYHEKGSEGLGVVLRYSYLWKL